MEEYDFGLGWEGLDAREYLFIKTIETECRQQEMRFLLVDSSNLSETMNRLDKGRLSIRFFLDLASETPDLENSFTKFAYRLKDAGCRVVADPDKVRFSADKSITHFSLVEAGINVPYTVIIRNWDPERRLTPQERSSLGLPIIIKPATGYAQRGVMRVNTAVTLSEIAQARSSSPGDNFLLQRFVEPEMFGADAAWFRVFYLFGETAICWWNRENGRYRQVSLKEFDIYRLSPLVRITSEIAGIVGIEWFTCEICFDKDKNEFVVIDYMNDQFDVSSQTQRDAGVPDELLILLARRVVAKAKDYKLHGYPVAYRNVWFMRMKTKDEDA